MFKDNLRMAINSIRAARFRSFLTLLGVIIGVFSVITSVSLAEGVRNQVSTETTKLGNDVLTVRPGHVIQRDSGSLITGVNILGPASTSAILSEKDLATIRESDGIKSVVPLNLVSGLPNFQNKTYQQALIIGTSPGLPQMINQSTEYGNFFGEDDRDKKVAVIGSSVAEKLFGQLGPVGQSFKIRDQEFIVKGVLERNRNVSVSHGVDFNNALFIPYQAAKDLNSGVAQSYEILVRVDNLENIDSTEAALVSSLKNNRGGQEDFTILQASDTQAVTSSVLDLITAMVGAVAVISMLVGGIGIMNIMLVSVTERTREIGIRKAVGAADYQILRQFILEAAVLSAWGAVLGVIFSILFNIGIRIFTNLQPVISWEVVVVSLFASVIIGVIFGTAPAVKAARKDPIDSLRYGL